jgi:site-specific recombinase XerD
VISIQSAGESWLASVSLARSKKTHLTYSTAFTYFMKSLIRHGINPADKVKDISAKSVIQLSDDLKVLAPTTEKLYLGAVRGFYKFLLSEEWAPINMAKIDAVITQRSRRPGVRVPLFAAPEIKLVLTRLDAMPISRDPEIKLRDLRDKALIITLAHTGLRIHEACNLTRGGLDMNEGQALVIGKGNKQSIVRFTGKSLKSIKAYLTARAPLDGGTGKPLSVLPIFARHDAGAGRKIKPITTQTGREIVKATISKLLSADEMKRITPHSFRHYFVTEILRVTHNLKLAQSLARHENIEMTQRYAHLSDDELDKGFHDVFETK